MARIRYLKPEFFKDEDLAALPYEVRLFYAGLWGLADKAGRLEDRPQRLKAEIFPYDPVDAEKCLSLLAKSKRGSGKPFIHRYTTDSQRYIQILCWDKHQKPHHTERESEIPPAPPLMEKGTEKGMEKQDGASVKLSNGDVTVIVQKQHRRASPFVPPTVQEVEAYCKEKGYQVDAQQFIEYYAAAAWHDRDGLPVKSWKQKIISVWSKKDTDHRAGGKTLLYPIPGRTCGVDGCKMPAVYKSVGGAYDNYYCAEHMPEKVKAAYRG